MRAGWPLPRPLASGLQARHIPRWDFDWQLAYRYDTPVKVGPDDSATITCTFNTMERTESVRWGDGTQDGMCLSFMYITLVP